MTDDREFWTATTDWLEAGSDRTPPHAVDAVLLAVRTTHQDRPLPIRWRTPTMPPIARVLIAAAAVVALSLVAFNLGVLPGGTGVQMTPVPTATPSPTPTPLAVVQGETPSPLSAGARYLAGDPFEVPFSFEAPASWSGHMGGQYAVFLGASPDSADVWFQLFDLVFTDPCHPDKGDVVGIGPSPADLVNAIVARPGLIATTPVQTTVAGTPATRVTLTLTQSPAACANNVYSIWELPLGATNDIARQGASEDVYVLEQDNQRLIVTVWHDPSETQVHRDVVQRLLDSVRFEPTS